MQEEMDTARTSRQSGYNELHHLISDDHLQIDSRFTVGSPIIGLIRNTDSHQINRQSPLDFDTDEGDNDDEDFDFEFPSMDRKLLSNAEQIQTVRCASAKSSSCGNGNGSSAARGTRSIRRWGVSIREMLNWREKSERKASWFVRSGSSKKAVAEEEKRRWNGHTSSYRIVGLGLFYRV